MRWRIDALRNFKMGQRVKVGPEYLVFCKVAYVLTLLAILAGYLEWIEPKQALMVCVAYIFCERVAFDYMKAKLKACTRIAYELAESNDQCKTK